MNQILSMPENIDDFEIIKAENGSPYSEIQKISDRVIEINPFYRLSDIIEELYEEEEFFDTDEGKLLFDILVKTINDVDLIRNIGINQFEKNLLELELNRGCFGERCLSVWKKMNSTERENVLTNLCGFYQTRESIVPFINLVQALLPGSIVFRKKTNLQELFIYVGCPVSSDLEERYYLAKRILLPVRYHCYITWDKPFLMTNVEGLHSEGSKII